MIDAMVGEITVTLEKLRWTGVYGEQYLLPEYRDPNIVSLRFTGETSFMKLKPVRVWGGEADVDWMAVFVVVNVPTHSPIPF